MGSRDDSVARPVILFAMAGLLALGLVAASGIVVVRRLAADEALSEAQQLTAISARVVERRVNDGLLTGDAESLAAIASVVFPAVLHDPIVRVKIWAADGTILYSDKSRLIGSRYTLGDEELGTLMSGDVVAELSDLQAPENRYERSFGQLMEVYTRIETPGGTPLLFETYQRASSIAGSGRELAWTFAPVLVVSLVARVRDPRRRPGVGPDAAGATRPART
jgi:two-component system NarL family sensor kinase